VQAASLLSGDRAQMRFQSSHHDLARVVRPQRRAAVFSY
jgi:hypothetical protein